MTHPTDALRLVPVSLISDTMNAMARAYERIHSMPRVSDTELAKKVDEAKERLRPYLAAPASPLPEGGGNDPHERWGILNHLGGIWTEENFGTERQARSYLERCQDRNPKIDLSGHKVIPVLITITAAPTGGAK